MTRKYIIKAPRTPKNEEDRITILNMDRQIKILIDRCEELEAQRCIAHNDCVNAEKASDAAQDENRSLLQQIADRREAYIRLAGWRDCARELFDLIRPKA